MDFDPALILIILFILAPLLERLLKGGKKQVPPDAPQRRVPPPRQRPEQRPHRTPEIEEADGEGSAAEMLPEDLWAILTGQRPAERPRPEPPPPPPPARPQPPQPRTATARQQRAESGAVRERSPLVQKRRLPPVDMRTKLPPVKEREVWRQPPSEAYTAEGYVRDVPVHAPPEIVSLEKLEFDDEKRHATFHQRVAEMSGPEVVHRTAAHPLRSLLRQPADVRQAIVLREVLGPPKALE